MARERLMEEQRARMEARRKKLKEAVKKAAENKKTAKTRDTSKDQSRKKIERLTGGKQPKTGDKAKATISKFAGKKPAPAAKSAPAAKPKSAPSSKGRDRFFAGAKGGPIDKAIQNEEKAKSNFFAGSSGTRGSNVPSNPKLKSQAKKPSRNDFPAGRTGASSYAAAMNKYRKAQERLKANKPKKKVNRRGRAY